MKQLKYAFIAIITVWLTGCTSGGSPAVDEFLDGYEEIVVGYEEMVSNGTMATGDIMAMMKAVNEMNEKSIEWSAKADALNDQVWTSDQVLRYSQLGTRFSEALMKMSQQM